jgi:sarcosine oxidase subunit gamma
VADLAETPPFAGLSLPAAVGRVRLTALPMAQMHLIAPFPGTAPAVAARLGGFPAPGQVLETATGRLVWAGREAAMLWGIPPDLAGLAAVTDQSDGWAGLQLAGPDAAEVLARLVPVDLAALAPPAAIRSLLNHLPLLLIHPAPDVFDLWSYRSMAGTLAHEVETAARRVAARAARG